MPYSCFPGEEGDGLEENWTKCVLIPDPQIRGTLKSWTKLWCVLKPGVLLIYKTPKIGQWVGTILLQSCELIERPSKKDGFCFKLFHPLDQSIWAVKVNNTLDRVCVEGPGKRKRGRNNLQNSLVCCLSSRETTQY